MRYTLNILLITLALLGLAACGGGAPTGANQLAPSQPTSSALPPTVPPEPTGVSQPTARPAAQPTALPETTAEAQPAANATIVVYHKSGGIMGLDETLTVQADGTLVFKSRDNGGEKTIQVRTTELDKLRALIASPEFAQLKPRYQAAGADLFTYAISVPGGTPANVTTMDGVENPPVLDQVIQELNQLRQQL